MAWGRIQRFAVARSRAGVDRGVRCLVRHAYRHIPYYRRLFDEADADPLQIVSTKDLPLLPITDRTVFASLPASESVDPRVRTERCFRHQTSGTSGTRLTVTMRRSEHRYRQFILARALLRGLRLRPPIRIAEVGRILKPELPELSSVLGFVIVARPPGQAPLAQQAEALYRHRPQIIEGFPTALEVLADYCRKEGISIPAPQRVVCRGEMLLPKTRALLASVFRAPVLDFYSCEEIGNIAWQCPHDPQTMHINWDACVVEAVDRSGEPLPAGERGMLALTSLYNHTMPFIRYLLGDRGALLPQDSERCSCGARGPRMALLDGRADDLLHLPNGQAVSPRVAATVLFRLADGTTVDGVHRYQIVQEAIDRLLVRVVLKPNAGSRWREVLEAAVQRELPGLSLEVLEVDEIPFEYSGKVKKVQSKLRAL